MNYLKTVFKSKGLLGTEKDDRFYLTKCPSCHNESKAFVKSNRIYCHKDSCDLYGGKKVLDYFDKEYIYGNLGKWTSMYEMAATHFNKELLNDNRAIEILTQEEGFTRAEIEQFKIGIVKNTNYLKDDDNGLWRDGSEGELKFKYNDGMIVYPIIKDEEVVSMRFKYQISNGEYKKSWETRDGDTKRLDFVMAKEFTGDIVPKLYNHDDLNNFDNIIIVEGEGDVVMMKVKFPEVGVIGIGGSGGNSPDTFNYINSNFKKSKFHLCFDNDDSGWDYTLNFVKNLKNIHGVYQYSSGDPKDAVNDGEEFEEITIFDWLNENADELREKGDLVAHKIKGKDGTFHFLNYYSMYFNDEKGKRKEFKVPITEPTSEIMEYSKNLISFKCGKKSFIIDDKKNEFCYNYQNLMGYLWDDGYSTELIANPTVGKTELHNMFESKSRKIDRITRLVEDGGNDNGTYSTREYNYEAEDNGLLLEFINKLTLKNDKDRYIYAGMLFSMFLGRGFDGNKPFFAAVADDTSYGKTAIIKSAANLAFDGSITTWVSGKEDDLLNDIGTFSCPMVLYDNLEAKDLKNNSQYFTLQTTSEEVKTHIMGESHANIRNSFTHCSTINAQELDFNSDLLARILVLNTNGNVLSQEERMALIDYVDNADIDGIRRNIKWYLENKDYDRANYIAHVKFEKWSKEMTAILSNLFTNVGEFIWTNEEKITKNNRDVEWLQDLLEDAYDYFKSNRSACTDSGFRILDGGWLQVTRKALFDFGMEQSLLSRKYTSSTTALGKAIETKVKVHKMFDFEKNNKGEFTHKFNLSDKNKLSGCSQQRGVIYKPLSNTEEKSLEEVVKGKLNG